MSAYYNEIDPYCAEWLRNLMTAGHIPAGDVDERDIRDVAAADLTGYRQCHFFAGVGGWAYAMRLAGWPNARPVWTGSCPCQPFSVAGQRKGDADERHLWPEFRRLIGECAPAIVFGEQVAGADGRQWLAGVRADMEALGYAVGAADLCAASKGSPHIRQRLFWVADSNGRLAGDRGIQCRREHGQQQEDGCAVVGMADANHEGLEERAGIGSDARTERETAERGSATSGMEHATGEQVGISGRAWEQRNTHWSDFDIVYCADRWPDGTQKARRIESGSQPLAHGVSGRMVVRRAVGQSGTEIQEHWYNRQGALKAFGNAIVPQVAAEVIRAMMR